MDPGIPPYDRKTHSIFTILFLPVLLFLILTIVFFHPILKGYAPFPGDLLVGEYAPYNTYDFLGYAPGGFPNKAQGFDIIRMLYPAKEFSIKSLKNFSLPLWNPYILSGNPHMANLQSGVFYITNSLFFLFDHITAWTIYIFIQPFLSGIFTFFLLREFRLSDKSSYIGSIAFAFSSYMTVWIEYGNLGHTIIWLPLTLLMITKLSNRFTILNSLVLVLSLSFSILAGYIQTTFYLFTFAFIFSVFITLQNKKNLKKNIILFSVLFVFPLLLTSFQLLPTFELILLSVRPNFSSSELFRLLIPQYHLITLLVPDFFGNPATRNYWLTGTYIERVSYIGIIPFTFAVLGISRKMQKIHAFFLFSTFSIYLLAFDTFVSRGFYSLGLPLVSTAVPTRIMFIFCFSISVLSAFGYELFESSYRKIDLRKILGIGLILIIAWFFVFLALYTFKDADWLVSIPIVRRNLILPTIIFSSGSILLFLSAKINYVRRYSFFILLLLTIFELFYFFHKITPFSPREAIYPHTPILEYIRNNQGIFRSWGYDRARIDTNLQIHEMFFTTDGYEPLHNKRYSELLSVSQEGKVAKALRGNIAEILTADSSQTLADFTFRKKLLDLMGIKYILHYNGLLEKEINTRVFPQDQYQLLWQKGKWQVFENKNVWPRYFLGNDYIVEKDPDKIISLLMKDHQNTKEVIILEEKLPFELSESSTFDSNLSLISYSANKVVLETQAIANTLLFISDNYFPGWKVRIDEETAKIYRANYTFRAVPVPSGKHTVIFSYEPASFYLGLKISLVSLLIGISWIFLARKRRYVE